MTAERDGRCKYLGEGASKQVVANKEQQTFPWLLEFSSYASTLFLFYVMLVHMASAFKKLWEEFKISSLHEMHPVRK
jgi:hypothetical protein